MNVYARILMLFLLAFSLIAHSNEDKTSLNKLEESDRKFLEKIMSNIDNMQVALLNGVNVKSFFFEEPVFGEAEADYIPTLLLITEIKHPELPKVLVGKEQNKPGYGIEISKDDGAFSLNVEDGNGDGVLDLIYYFVGDSEGATKRRVWDYGADGQMDIVVEHETREYKAFLEGKWVVAESIKQERGYLRRFKLSDGSYIGYRELIQKLDKKHHIDND